MFFEITISYTILITQKQQILHRSPRLPTEQTGHLRKTKNLEGKHKIFSFELKKPD